MGSYGAHNNSEQFAVTLIFVTGTVCHETKIWRGGGLSQGDLDIAPIHIESCVFLLI